MTSPPDRYRPDIDGLRALAVLLVVFYHLGLGFRGGYCGVDVFFVISGYLITRLLLKDFATGRFRFSVFWERRARRLGPALLVNAGFIAVLSYFFLPPAELYDLGWSLLATPGAWTNVLFWQTLTGGYFGGYLEYRPTLHYWSLAVEEQFYLVFPLLLGLLFRWRSCAKGLLCITAVSYLASVLLTPSRHMLAFFLLPTRAWELALGGLLVFLPESKKGRQPLLMAGAALILLCGLDTSPEITFPGWRALLPCLGASWVILADCRHSILASRPFVFVGKCSYSLYLWHWPLFAFACCAYGQLSDLQRWLLMGLSLALSAVSYRLVETPVRERRVLSTSMGLVVGLGLAAVALSLVGSTFVRNNGLPGRFSPAVVNAFEARRDIGNLWEMNDAQVALKNFGRLGETGAPVTFLLWGDSHAIALAPAFDLVARRRGLGGLQATRSTTAPLLLPLAGQDSSNAQRMAAAVLSTVSEQHIQYVILAARWQNYKDPEFVKSFAATVAELRERGARPLVVFDVPNLRQDPIALFGRAGEPQTADLGLSYAEYQASQENLSQALAKAALPKAQIVELAPVFFAAGKSFWMKDSRYLYRDADHLTSWGARQVVPLLEALFDAQPVR